MVSKGDFWLESFESWLSTTRIRIINSEKDFLRALFEFLEHDNFVKYRSDIKFNSTGQIIAIKIIMRIRGLGAHNDEPRAELLRKQLRISQFDGFVYDTRFFYLISILFIYF